MWERKSQRGRLACGILLNEDKTMFRLRAASLYVLPGLIFLASCAWNSCSEAQSAKSLSAGQAMNFIVEGKVNTLDHNKLTVHTEENIIFHVSYNDKTEFKSDDGSPASSKDLRVGLKIKVDGDLTESGEIVAQKIELEKTPPKK
jgi:hypothetical protein